MTHAERMAALVAEATKAPAGRYDPVMSLKTGWKIGRIENHTARPMEDSDDAAAVDFACAAANARPTIALAAEGMKALKLYRAATKQRAEDEREHCAAGLTYSIEDLVAIEERVDALLAEWGETT